MVILASSSPRRKELLKKIFNDFVIIKPSFDENLINKNDKELAKKEAYFKGLSILNDGKDHYNDLIISCDTIVKLNEKVYGKPSNLDEAKKFLKELSNNTHQVISGYALFYKGKVINKESISYVTFNNLTDEDISIYIENEYVLDKAGAYGIQDDEKFHLIYKIKGSLYNIIGLPIEDIKSDLDILFRE